MLTATVVPLIQSNLAVSGTSVISGTGGGVPNYADFIDTKFIIFSYRFPQFIFILWFTLDLLEIINQKVIF